MRSDFSSKGAAVVAAASGGKGEMLGAVAHHTVHAVSPASACLCLYVSSCQSFSLTPRLRTVTLRWRFGKLMRENVQTRVPSFAPEALSSSSLCAQF